MAELITSFPLITAMVVAVIMISMTSWIQFEVLNFCEKIIPKMSLLHGRLRVVAIVLGSFIGHVISIWMYAFCFFILVKLGVGGLHGGFTGEPAEYLYYSTVSYTSLGLGDMFPSGALRLITGVEALNGLVLITWSASYTYLYMQKIWRWS